MYPDFQPPVRTLETPRLSIRIDTEADYVLAFRTLSDEELKERFGLTDEALAAQRHKVSGHLSTYRTSVVFFHLFERALGRVIGSVAYHNWYPEHRRAEIGYALSEESAKSKGYMREALPPVIRFGFEELRLNRIEAFIGTWNEPSLRLVQRSGFQREGLLRDHYARDGVAEDSVLYALLARDYEPDEDLLLPPVL